MKGLYELLNKGYFKKQKKDRKFEITVNKIPLSNKMNQESRAKHLVKIGVDEVSVTILHTVQIILFKHCSRFDKLFNFTDSIFLILLKN